MTEYLSAFQFSLLFGFFGWLYSYFKTNVNIVDTMWSLFFIINILCFAHFDALSTNQLIILLLMCFWAFRLAGYLCIRNAFKSEDSRYMDIRRKYSPNFAFKSLLIIFIFQSILALIISYPLYYIYNPIQQTASILLLNISYGMIGFGILYESIADWQLLQFKRSQTKTSVCTSGLWRFSRHPNYFGELLIVWGIFINAYYFGHIFTIVAPIIMTYFLFKFSGAGLMEETILQRKPKYADYIRATNSIFPWLPK